MAITPEDDDAKVRFSLALFNPDALLPAAVEFIADNFEPGDVFPREKLEAWAVAAGYILLT